MLYPESEYTKVFHEADTDRDGYIGYLDLRKLVLYADKTFPEAVIKVAFNEAKLRPPTDLMDLKEFLEAMGKLESYRRGGWMSFKGPILYSKLSSSMQHWLRSPRFARWLYEQFFIETDADKDGFITYEEFLVTLTKYEMEYLALTVKYEFRKHNSRSDGFMNMVDFMIAMGFPPLDPIEPIQKVEVKTEVKAVKKQKMPKFQLGASLLRQIFTSMDQDNDGVLNKEELKGVFLQLGQEMSENEIEALFSANDKQGDGCLTYDEFVNSVYPTVTKVEGSDEEEEITTKTTTTTTTIAEKN